ncbi:MAG: InlB B-repeat-containing protein [Clostridia bacterium]|nr:InlB B-repeat-containing protein [Clostridia bacterium]
MKKISKQIVSLLLITLLLTNYCVIAFAYDPVKGSTDTSDVGIANGQGMGTLLNGLLSDQEEAENEICYISSITMTDRTASVELFASQACTLVVAVYDEMTKEMLGSGVTNVAAQQTEASVEIQSLSLPETYLVKGFLLDENNKAVGRHFVTMEYTQAYQTFLETTPEDFNSEETIYFDKEEKEENFAVLKDDVISGTVNASMTWTYDAETSAYSFVNATNEVKALNIGDIFYYEYGDSGNEFLLFKVKAVTYSGTNVTITEDEDISLEDVFSFIRIEHGINNGSDFIDESQLPESLQKEALVKAQTEIINQDGKVTLSDSLTIAYNSSDNGGASISGKVGVEFTAAAKLYYDMRWGKDYYEFKLEFSFKFNFTVSVSGKIQVRKDNFYFPLLDIPIGPFVLEGKAYPVISFSVKIDAFKVEYTSSFKLYVSSESNGPQANTDSSKKWESDFGNTKIEIKIGVGFEFGVSLVKLVEAGFDVEAGSKIVGDPDIVGIHNDIHHNCDVCFSCEMRLYAEGSIFLKIKLFTDKLSLRWDAIKLSYDSSRAHSKFYISVKNRALDAGFGACPRKMLAVKFRIIDESDKPISNAAVSCATGVCDINGDGVFEAKEIKTAEDGIATLWFNGSKHVVTVKANGYQDKTQTVEVAEIGKSVTIRMTNGSGGSVTPGGNNDFDGDLANCSVGDVINFGSYPQSQVTNQTTLLKLEAKSQGMDWTAYPYYIEGVQTEYMYYLDLQLGTDYYRGVRFNCYRPRLIKDTGFANKSLQDENGFYPNITYWFLYEPLQWRVLNPYTGFVLSMSIIDSQTFNYTDESHSSGKYASNWAESTIRQWLNTTFINDAFNGAEQKQISTTTLDTPCPSEGNSAFNVGKTKDKVFLLSYYDAINSTYGFRSDQSKSKKRAASGTSYARCQGLRVYNDSYASDESQWINGNSYSWLRSPDGTNSVYKIGPSGMVDVSVSGTASVDFGVRPAMQLHLASGSAKAHKIVAQSAAENAETRTVQQGMRYTATASRTIAGNEYVLLVRQAGTTGLATDDLYYIDQQTAADNSVVFAYIPRISGECTVEIIGDFAPPVIHTVRWVVDDTITEQQIEEGATIVVPAEPQKDGYIFIDWSPDVPTVMPAQDLTFTAQFKKVVTPCTVAVTASTGGSVTGSGTFDEGESVTVTATPSEGYMFAGWYNGVKHVSDKAIYSFTVTNSISLIAQFEKTPNPVIKIHDYTASKTIDYRATITFSVDEIQNPVDGASVHWFIDGQDKGATDTFTMMEARQKFIIQAKYVKDSSILAESETEIINVNTRFFARLKAFFRALFGRLPKVVQEYLRIEFIDRILPD